MIRTCTRRWFDARCKQSGMSPEECAQYVTRDDGTTVMADISAFPPIQATNLNSTSGPGTELKALLAKIGIHASPTCGCNKMARKMDKWGQESLDHIEEIVDVMEQTAKGRKLPFLRAAGRILVRQACRISRKKGNSK
jgi:hypothetical protein